MKIVAIKDTYNDILLVDLKEELKNISVYDNSNNVYMRLKSNHGTLVDATQLYNIIAKNYNNDTRLKEFALLLKEYAIDSK